MHFWLHHTAHCAEKIVSACYACGSASAERVGQGEVGGGHPQGDMYMVAARLGCQNAMVGTMCCTWWPLGLAVKVPGTR